MVNLASYCIRHKPWLFSHFYLHLAESAFYYILFLTCHIIKNSRSIQRIGYIISWNSYGFSHWLFQLNFRNCFYQYLNFMWAKWQKVKRFQQMVATNYNTIQNLAYRNLQLGNMWWIILLSVNPKEIDWDVCILIFHLLYHFVNSHQIWFTYVLYNLNSISFTNQYLFELTEISWHWRFNI